MKIKNFLTLFITVVALMAGMTPSVAAVIGDYKIVLTVTEVGSQYHNSPACDPLANGKNSFGCVNVGDVFTGSFSITSSNGISDFRLSFGNAYYSTGLDNLTLSSFYNPQISNTLDENIGGPGIVVDLNDVVVDLEGNVSGEHIFGSVLGLPTIQFFNAWQDLFPRNSFTAVDGIILAHGDLSITRINHSIPEPATLLLVALPLGLFAATRRKRRRAE